MYCEKCGTHIENASAEFCFKCGTTLAKVSGQSPTPTTQQAGSPAAAPVPETSFSVDSAPVVYPQTLF
ncbi:MAG: zinc-ribbon domain-containing protein [Chloroflexi bacterium]|jgi:hypothetical protein|nr:zinc-ribbon domain-containing protein [Chloroflexota bacterium]MBT7080785.1 zinc-ribbon domain-containing protein [Chloroflexota bacterium]MBT7289719.1 zinc-ribbon domain-containing protein [Chloroflexota bacterium]